MNGHRKLTGAELLAELKQRFGDDHMKWAFRCPNCGDVATGQDFRDALKAHPPKRNDPPVYASQFLGRKCIGRLLGALKVSPNRWKGRGCDWVAYGLKGPWEVVMADGRSLSGFPIADAPAEATP